MENVFGLEKPPCIIFELGAKYTKIGFGNDSDPRKILLTPEFFNYNNYIDDPIKERNIFYYIKDFLDVKYKIEEFIQYIFIMVLQIKKVLREKNYTCLLLIDFDLKKKMQKLIKEIIKALLSYSVISTVRIAPKNIFPIFASGYGSGIIVEGGYLRSTITAMNNGVEIAKVDIDLGSCYLAKELKKMILEDKEGIQAIKPELLEAFSSELNKHLDDILVRSAVIVNRDLALTIYQEESKMKGEKDYTKIDCYDKLSEFQLSFLNRVKIGEKLFDKMDEYNISYQLLDFIQKKIPNEIRKKLVSNIVLSGGLTMLFGFYRRFCEEITARIQELEFDKLHPLSSAIHVHKIIFPRNCLGWIGASLVMNFDKISSKKYEINKDENGIFNKEISSLFD